MSSVDQLHTGVAVVCAAKSTPVFGVGVELVSLLSATLQRGQAWLKWLCWCSASCLSHTPCDIYNCGFASVWVWLQFDLPMTNPSAVGWWSIPCAAHHHIRKHLTRGTAGTELMWQTSCCTERTKNNTWHCCCWWCCSLSCVKKC